MVLIYVAVAVVLIFAFIGRKIVGGAFGMFIVVPVNEAHIRIMSNRKTVFCSRTGSSEYWRIPFISKVHRLPLSNLSVPVNDIKLNDRDMAKFICDLMCFINIENIDLAAERLTLTDSRSELGFDFEKLQDELRAIMESIGRTVTTKQTLLDIYMNRDLLDNAITEEVKKVFPQWGIALVDLELKDIKDASSSTIIADIERKIASQIRRDAEIQVSEADRQARVKKAENEEAAQQREIARDQAIAIRKQEAEQRVAETQKAVNQMAVEASLIKLEGDAKNRMKVITIDAEAARSKVEIEANAASKAMSVRAEGEANATRTTGTAEADIIKAKKLADAEGTEKLALALQKFDEKALGVKTLEVNQAILTAKFQALAAIAEKADIKWIMSGANGQSFFGLDLTAEGGANLEQFLSMNPKLQEVLAKLTAK